MGRVVSPWWIEVGPVGAGGGFSLARSLMWIRQIEALVLLWWRPKVFGSPILSVLSNPRTGDEES